jgi:hypothetical protein
MSNVLNYRMAVGLALTLTACAPAWQEEYTGFNAPASRESSLLVRNNYASEIHIYAVLGSTRSRIGSVTAGGSAEFHIPRQLLDRPELQLQADPVGPDPAFTFPAFQFRPGLTVHLTVEASLPTSSYSIR